MRLTGPVANLGFGPLGGVNGSLNNTIRLIFNLTGNSQWLTLGMF
jgi:hypothetical protein